VNRLEKRDVTSDFMQCDRRRARQRDEKENWSDMVKRSPVSQGVLKGKSETKHSYFG